MDILKSQYDCYSSTHVDILKSQYDCYSSTHVDILKSYYKTGLTSIRLEAPFLRN